MGFLEHRLEGVDFKLYTSKISSYFSSVENLIELIFKNQIQNGISIKNIPKNVLIILVSLRVNIVLPDDPK